MKAIVKPVIVLGIAGALALGSIAPSQARVRPWAAAGIGLAAGAAIASAANANAYYNGYYDPGYAAYAYDPYYAPAPAYVAPEAVPGYVYGYPSSSDDARYTPYYNGYDSNYIGPTRERQLQGHDY